MEDYHKAHSEEEKLRIKSVIDQVAEQISKMDDEHGLIKAVDIYKQYGNVDTRDLEEAVKINMMEDETY